MKEQAQATINSLKVEIVQAETELEKAQVEVFSSDQNVDVLRAHHLGLLASASSQRAGEESVVFQVLLKKVAALFQRMHKLEETEPLN
eukprot:4503740-Karenia_brevis.AAC.1